MLVIGLQHAFGTQSLLAGKTFVVRKHSAVKLRKQAKDSVETRKAILIERDDRHKYIGVGIRLQNLEAMLPTGINCTLWPKRRITARWL